MKCPVHHCICCLPLLQPKMRGFADWVVAIFVAALTAREGVIITFN